MRKKRIALVFGMEDTFPWALINAINARGGDQVEACPLEISYLKDDGVFPYDLILDRISHEVPFYRTYLKCAAASGVKIVNNPIWWSADDKFFDNLVAKAVGVAVPRTVLLPHKQYPPNTEAKSFRNMKWVNWDEVFNYLGWPIFMKPAYGGGWKDVYKVHNPHGVLRRVRPDARPDDDGAGGDRVRLLLPLLRPRTQARAHHAVRPEAAAPSALRREFQPPAELEQRMHRDAIALCEGLGYDMNTVEFAVRDGIPYAIDFMNAAPDADVYSVGQENFDWMVDNMAEVLIEIVTSGKPLELTGNWPQVMNTSKPADQPIAGPHSAARGPRPEALDCSPCRHAQRSPSGSKKSFRSSIRRRAS